MDLADLQPADTSRELVTALVHQKKTCLSVESAKRERRVPSYPVVMP